MCLFFFRFWSKQNSKICSSCDDESIKKRFIYFISFFFRCVQVKSEECGIWVTFTYIYVCAYFNQYTHAHRSCEADASAVDTLWVWQFALIWASCALPNVIGGATATRTLSLDRDHLKPTTVRCIGVVFVPVPVLVLVTSVVCMCLCVRVFIGFLRQEIKPKNHRSISS